MFKKMIEWLRTQLRLIFGEEVTSDVLVSGTMENALQLWVQLYETGGPWCSRKSGVFSLDLAGSIAREFARLVLLEADIEISGSARADYLQEQVAALMLKMPEAVESAAALGGVAFKPCCTGDRIVVEVVQADAVIPTSFDSTGNMTGAIFPQQLTRDGKVYTRLERHEFDPSKGVETIDNKAFASGTNSSLGREIGLEAIPEWERLAPHAVLTGLEHPTFVYFRMPDTNRVDRSSPLGMSVFAPAVKTIRTADEQFGRLLWEYKGGELAVDVDDRFLEHHEGGDQMPERDARLFRKLAVPGMSGENVYHIYAPTLRDQSYRDGLDNILKRIEFQVGLAYGTLSDPQTVDKTAEEVKASKQRSYAHVKAIQTALEGALRQLVYVLDVYATAYQLAPAGSYEVTCDWDDSLVNDPNDRRTRFWGYVLAGHYPMEDYLVNYENYTEEEAADLVARAKAANSSTESLTFGG